MPKKILTGIVVSDKPNKTITVMVERKYSHPLLKKVVRVRKKYNAHDENNKFKNGDKVSIIESKPYSKNKKFEMIKKTKNTQTKRYRKNGDQAYDNLDQIAMFIKDHEKLNELSSDINNLKKTIDNQDFELNFIFFS